MVVALLSLPIIVFFVIVKWMCNVSYATAVCFTKEWSTKSEGQGALEYGTAQMMISHVSIVKELIKNIHELMMKHNEIIEKSVETQFDNYATMIRYTDNLIDNYDMQDAKLQKLCSLSENMLKQGQATLAMK